MESLAAQREQTVRLRQRRQIKSRLKGFQSRYLARASPPHVEFALRAQGASGRGSGLVNPSVFGIVTLVRERASRIVFSGYDLVQMKNIGCHGINLVCTERLRRIKRHRAPDVIEQSGCVRPETTNRSHRLRRAQRAVAPHEPIGKLALPLLAVTERAGLCINLLTILHTAAPFR